MSSEDFEAVKKEEARDDEDGEYLNSMLKDRKKANPNASSAKSRPREVAKEEAEDDDHLPINASFGSRSKGARVKKEENGNGGDFGKQIKAKAKKAKNDDSEEDDKPIKQRSSASKSDKQLKKKKEVIKKIAAAAEQNGKKREKKVYDLPGQKRDPPEERDPLRIFYETLHKQVPNSEMAQIWMMESGLLPKKEAEKVFGAKQKKATLQKLGTPTKVVKKKAPSVSESAKRKSVPSPAPSTKTKTAASKKRKNEDDGSSDDDDGFVVRRVVNKQRAA